MFLIQGIPYPCRNGLINDSYWLAGASVLIGGGLIGGGFTWNFTLQDKVHYHYQVKVHSVKRKEAADDSVYLHVCIFPKPTLVVSIDRDHTTDYIRAIDNV